MNNTDKWNNLHHFYSSQDWIEKTNIFAEEAIQYFPKNGSILCLGDGQGQDGRFFAAKGFTVLSTDISDSALDINRQKISETGLKNVTAEKLDLTSTFPYDENTFDIVYAHLSLHYFSETITRQIFSEIKRVLKPGGILAAFVNSIHDPEYNTGKKLGEDFFEIEGYAKRFFSIESMKNFAHDFEILILDDNGRTYKDEAKGVHNLIRFIGRKTNSNT